MDAGKSVVVAAEPEDVRVESRFKTLNSSGFVRGKTDKHQWYLLVSEAWNASRMPVNEMVRDYLAMMLYRFMDRAELLEQLAAFDFYRHVLGIARTDALCAQDIADISLQYVAFFPERSSNRHQPRSVGYVAEIGASLYWELARDAKGKDDWFSQAYRSMADSFGSAVIVLRSVCPRFARHRGQALEGMKSDVIHFPGLSETMMLGAALSNFNGMYFQGKEHKGAKNN